MMYTQYIFLEVTIKYILILKRIASSWARWSINVSQWLNQVSSITIEFFCFLLLRIVPTGPFKSAAFAPSWWRKWALKPAVKRFPNRCALQEVVVLSLVHQNVSTKLKLLFKRYQKFMILLNLVKTNTEGTPECAKITDFLFSKYIVSCRARSSRSLV